MNWRTEPALGEGAGYLGAGAASNGQDRVGKTIASSMVGLIMRDSAVPRPSFA